MTAVDTRITQVAVFGRAADELTRTDLTPRQFRATVDYPRAAIQKEDGHFVFADLPASPPNYQVELTGRAYQTRRLTVTNPGGATPLEINPDGEDELQVIATSINGNRVSFAALDFLPTISQGAQVIGEGGFATTLAETADGADADGVELTAVAGFAADRVLRVVRSRRLLLRPGPYYAFPEATTVVAIRVVEATINHEPIPDVSIEITAVNGAPVTPVVVAGVTFFRAELPASPAPATLAFLIGTQAARESFTNARGDAVFYYTPTTPVTSLTLDISKTGYVTQTSTVAVQQGERVFSSIQLVRV